MGPAVFKTVEGAKVPWRVRFPSASANAFRGRPAVRIDVEASIAGKTFEVLRRHVSSLAIRLLVDASRNSAACRFRYCDGAHSPLHSRRF